MRQGAGRPRGRGRGRPAFTAAIAFLLAAAALLAAVPGAADQWASAEAPGRPTGLVADDVSPTKIALSWSAPDDDGEDVKGYKIDRKEAGGEYATIKRDTKSADTSYEDGGLETGTTYVYRVAAIGDDGTGEWSGEATGRPTSSSSPPEQKEPGKPRSLEADDVSEDEVRLEWDAPEDDNAPPVTGYRIEYKEAGEDEFETAEDDTGSTRTRHTVDGLDKGTEYVFRVIAINSVGAGEASDEASATPSEDSKPDAGQGKPGVPSRVTAEPASDTEIYVEWEGPRGGGAATWYVIQYKQKSGEYRTAAEVGAEAAAFVHEVPNPNTSYQYRVAARNDAGTGQYSGGSGFAKPAHTDRPTMVTVTELSPTSVRLDWRPPSQTYGQAIGGYEIVPFFANNVKGDPISASGGRGTSHTITGLETGKEHRFAVMARLATSESPMSETVSVTLTADSGKGGAAERTVVAQSPPGSPANVKATPRSSGQIDLAWDRPAPQGGQAVTGYRIEFKEGDGKEFETASADTGTSSATYSHRGLDPETAYTYRVSAISGIVVGPPSDEAAATTMEAGQEGEGQEGQASGGGGGGGGQASEEDLAPRDLEATQVAPDRIDLTWSEPASQAGGGGGVEAYRIESSRDGGDFVPLAQVGASSTSYSHTKIVPGASYSYRVLAMGGAGGAASNTATVDVPEGSGGEQEEERAASAGAGAVTTGGTPGRTDEATGDDGSVGDGDGGAPAGDDPLLRVPGFPDPTIGADMYVHLYETDEGFREFFDEVFPEYEITDIVGEPTGAGAGAMPAGDDPLLRVPGFPDPAVSAREYVERYESDLAFREWFDGAFPEYGITDVVGEPEPEPTPPPPDEPDRLPYYKGRYDGEAAYRAWFDTYFSGRSLAEVVGAGGAGGGAGGGDRQYGTCGAGTALRDGICQVVHTEGR